MKQANSIGIGVPGRSLSVFAHMASTRQEILYDLLQTCEGWRAGSKLGPSNLDVNGPLSPYGYNAAVFASRFAPSEGWWRRRESNPRPVIVHIGFYIHSLNFKFYPSSLFQAGYLRSYLVMNFASYVTSNQLEAILLIGAFSGLAGKTRKDVSLH